jgi:hypothetical protein
MNERIKELIAEAGIKLIEPSGHITAIASHAQLNQIEKFAELVVKECIGLAHDVCLGDESGEHGDTVSLVVNEIERHFKVKS